MSIYNIWIASFSILAIGIVVGHLIALWWFCHSTSGDLIVSSDEEGHYISLNLDAPPDKLKKHEYVVFKVKDITQK